MSTESGGRRRWWRWPLIGCGIGAGVILVVVIAVVVILVLIGLALREEEVASNLDLGEPVTIDDVRLTVDQFKMSESAGEEPFVATPAPGAKFLWIHVTAQNVGETQISRFVNVRSKYRGEEIGSSFLIQISLQDPAFPPFNSSVNLFPGAQSEGWKVFEVPVGLDPAEVAVLLKVGPTGRKVASWCLTELKSEDGC